MKKIILAFVTLLFWGFGTIQAQKLTISQLNLGTSVENREAVGIDTVFSADVGNIFCYTHVKGATDTTQIAHVWYYKEEEKARINLDIKSDDWRTWSSKKIMENWTGPWRVMVEDSNGNILAAKSFEVVEE